ncbi:hypothetical protein LOTGIDRAFT_127878 [Lottia gigantea]|uniref:Noggin n=1 Tax=Lottia gigantea TaxID=225164 RepID=V3ZXR8_LOTGI|nr:hypothetical protein LOTGIDRAFT_127878 [Lottia gigantea]ESO87395.1 hypothetical protein LOTGIDRAFT_127878 [Lottia gigantea]
MRKIQNLIVLCFTLHLGAHTSSELYFHLLEGEKDLTEKDILRQEKHRPFPSDTLPIMNLIENPNASYDPKPSDINRRFLKHLIGTDYDKDFMSYKIPKGMNFTTMFTLEKGRPAGKKPKFLKLIKTLKHINGQKFKLKLGKKHRRKFQKYLWNYTFCPVMYIWKDLGLRFWPRWIKEGTCKSKNQRSCSIPPGMECKPSGSTTKTILRWYCRKRSLEKVPYDCEWLMVKYPIITKCSCSC